MQMKKFLRHWISWLPSLFGLITVTLAYCHYQLIDDAEAYRESSLIAYEFIFLIGSYMALLTVLVALPVNLLKRNWLGALLNFLGVLGGYLSISYAMWLDSPTLVYIT